jgi:hypothetical protein
MKVPGRSQLGQSMVEYTIVTALGTLVLLGPGTDVIRLTLRAIQNNFSGYSYAMSLSHWPEFDIRGATPIASNVDLPPAGMADVGTRGGVLPPFPDTPDEQITDYVSFSYYDWLVSQGVPEERATELAGPSLDDVLEYITSYFDGGIPDFEEFPDDLPPSVSDIAEDLLPFDFF